MGRPQWRGLSRCTMALSKRETFSFKLRGHSLRFVKYWRSLLLLQLKVVLKSELFYIVERKLRFQCSDSSHHPSLSINQKKPTTYFKKIGGKGIELLAISEWLTLAVHSYSELDRSIGNCRGRDTSEPAERAPDTAQGRDQGRAPGKH